MALDRFDYDLENCSIKRSLDLLGEKWSLLILREAIYGVRRFDDFARALGCGRGVLSARIKALTAAGVLQRAEYRDGDQRPRPEYRLTEMGRDLFPILLGLSQWGDRWMPAPEGPAVLVTHRASGRPIVVAMTLDEGERRLNLRDVQVAPGPAVRRIAKASDPA